MIDPKEKLIIERQGNRMIKTYTKSLLENLKSREAMQLFPKYEDRDLWDAIDIKARSRVIMAGQAYINYEWPQLKASTYRQFVTEGLHEGAYNNRFMERRHALGSLLIAECAEGQGRFMDDLVNGVFALCEESTWLVPQHNMNMNKAVVMDDMTPCNTTEHIDLFSAETAALMTWCLYLMEESFNKISINIVVRIKKELNERIIKPYLTYTDYFWMGYTGDRKFVNNWNPWINCNCMTTFLMACDDQDKRRAGVAKIIESAQFYIDLLGDEGGCNEGPGYWTLGPGKLFELMEQLTYATGGKVDLYSGDKFKNMGSYIYKMYIGRDNYVNFSDAVAKDKNKDGGQIYRFGQASGDTLLEDFGHSIFQSNAFVDQGKQVFKAHSGPGHNTYRMYRMLQDLFLYEEIMASESKSPYCKAGFIRDIQIAVGRSEADSFTGMFFAAKGGNNAESHNHNDVGQVVIYDSGYPVLIDPGPMAYSRQYFDEHRYDFWATQSDYHNLPTINGCMQKDGKAYKATEVTYMDEEGLTGMQVSLDKAYPSEAKIKHWTRNIGLYRQAEGHSYVMISDQYDFESRSDMTCLNFITTRKPKVIDKASVKLASYETSPEIILSYDQVFADIIVETIDLRSSKKMMSQWGNHLYRIRFIIGEQEVSNKRIMTVRPSI